MRLVYLGTPGAAVPPLRALHDAGHEIVLVVSRPDARRGRGSARTPSPVKAAALELGLPVTDDLDDVRAVNAELGVVVAYGRIIPVELLDRLAMVNLHFSLLPRWRGAAPVERAILAGDERTGVCVMDVEEGLDTGGVHACAEVPIDDVVTAEELRAQLAGLGSELLVDTLARGLGAATPQSADGVTYARKLTPEDRQLHWDHPAIELQRVVRVGAAHTTFRGARFKVLAVEPAAEPLPEPAEPGTFVAATTVATGTGALRLLRVQPEGKAAMDAAAWANGARPVGEALGG
ncbi:MAG: methionyl-tRNA formyltransferase [Microthrixaceae bacterium]